MDIILDRKCPPKEEAPYNWRELGLIKNVSEEKQKTFCEQPIYQILPIKYLIKILLNGKLHFNKVLKSWEDPYELFLFKENIIIEGQSSNDYFSDYKHGYYGQCWSLIKDTDAMWRIYSHNKEGVRIKTSVGKMIQVLDQTRGYKNIVANFGVVKYLS